MSDVPHLDIEITKEDVESGAMKIAEILRPLWKEKKILIEDKSIGFLNLNYHCHTGSQDGFLIRLISSAVPDLKENTIKAMTYNKKHGIGASLLCTFNNGLVMEFLYGEAITWEGFKRIKDEPIWRGVAREVARYHSSTDMDEIRRLGIDTWKLCQEKFGGIIRGLYSSGTLSDSVVKVSPSADEIMNARAELQRHLLELGAEQCYAHMDTNPTNTVITQDRGPVFVDYDMCVVDFAAVNISGLMNSVLNIADLDFADLPTEAQKDVFIREYLAFRAEKDPRRKPVTERDVAFLKFLVRKADLMSYVSIVLAVVFSQSLRKSFPIDYAPLFWNKYLEAKDVIMAEKFE